MAAALKGVNSLLSFSRRSDSSSPSQVSDGVVDRMVLTY